MKQIVLIDNGSTMPEAVTNLRRLAQALGTHCGKPVLAQSLQHANRIDPTLIEDTPMPDWKSFLRQQYQYGTRELLLIPLFFGPSRALTRFVPDSFSSLADEGMHFEWRLAATLDLAGGGEFRLAQILLDNLLTLTDDNLDHFDNVILVDHGSPEQAVSEVRWRQAEWLQTLITRGVALHQASMERREGAEYDFNGATLETKLTELVEFGHARRIAISMLFLSPGRHAGANGDIAKICEKVSKSFPELEIAISPLVADHPAIIQILADRLEAALEDMG